MATVMSIRLVTKHDVNGNPRRLQLFVDATPPTNGHNKAGQPLLALDEGYSGYTATREDANKYFPPHTTIIPGPEITVTPAEWREWLRLYRKEN